MRKNRENAEFAIAGASLGRVRKPRRPSEERLRRRLVILYVVVTTFQAF